VIAEMYHRVGYGYRLKFEHIPANLKHYDIYHWQQFAEPKFEESDNLLIHFNDEVIQCYVLDCAQHGSVEFNEAANEWEQARTLAA
jgi:hypothetical protein